MKFVQDERPKAEIQHPTQVRRAWQPPMLTVESAEYTAAGKAGGMIETTPAIGLAS
jgi:hypothetical protein